MIMIDVQKLAREVGAAKSAINGTVSFRPYELERFAALVLEEAAKRCDVVQRMHSDHADIARDCGNEENQAFFEGAMVGAEDCADKIRSLKPKGGA